MKDIKIRLMGLGICSNLQAYVCIYDECNNLIYEGSTFNGEVIFCAKCNSVYRLCASFYGEVINQAFYTSSCNTPLIFAFEHSIYRNNTLGNVTFLLTDYYYENLPIEKGEIILWQK